MSFHFEYPRSIPEGRPTGFRPSAPKYQVRWNGPIISIVSDYIALQRSGLEPNSERKFFGKLRTAFNDVHGPDSSEEMRFTDDAGFSNSIVIGYWSSPLDYAIWRQSNAFNTWFASGERDRDDVGYWRETLIVPYDRLETIFSEPYYRAGMARTHNCSLEAMYTAGYFGAMRDRLPVGAIDLLRSPYGETVPETECGDDTPSRVRISVPPNLVSIRSGQYWQDAQGEQLDDYRDNLQPKLEVGMRYLQDNVLTTGCLSMRAMVNLDDNGQELRETSKHGYFLSLSHLERWAASHKSHLDIYKHALAMRKKFGSARSVVTWHEVFVLGTTPSFEYINCHRETGLLRFFALWGYALAPAFRRTPLPLRTEVRYD